MWIQDARTRRRGACGALFQECGAQTPQDKVIEINRRAIIARCFEHA